MGLASEGRWREAGRGARLLGAEEGRYPYDFADWVRYQRALAELPRAGPRPSRLGLDELDLFLDGGGGGKVSWG